MKLGIRATHPFIREPLGSVQAVSLSSCKAWPLIAESMAQGAMAEFHAVHFEREASAARPAALRRSTRTGARLKVPWWTRWPACGFTSQPADFAGLALGAQVPIWSIASRRTWLRQFQRLWNPVRPRSRRRSVRTGTCCQPVRGLPRGGTGPKTPDDPSSECRSSIRQTARRGFPSRRPAGIGCLP